MGAIAILGLALWSVSAVIFLYTVLRNDRHRQQEQHFRRKYGYFHVGLEPDMYWWEMTVKKLDMLCLSVITFTELFEDPRAKLIMYLVVASVFLAIHNAYHPFDDRQNCLADRLEFRGPRTHFLTLSILRLLLVLGAGSGVNIVAATVLI